MALNILLCKVWAELTRILKKSKLRRKPNTTEVAVKPEREKKKDRKKNPSAHTLSLCLFQGQLCI